MQTISLANHRFRNTQSSEFRHTFVFLYSQQFTYGVASEGVTVLVESLRQFCGKVAERQFCGKFANFCGT